MSYNSFSNSDLEYEKRQLQEMPIEEPEEVVATDLPETPREEAMHKGNKSPDYESLFVQEVHFKARTGKSVYIRTHYHELITKITHVIGKNEVSIFSYLDNVLKQHFEAYQDEIAELYEKSNKISFKP